MADDLRDLSAVDRIIQNPRACCCHITLRGGQVDFLFAARNRTTKGNLSAHLSKLEEAGYVLIENLPRQNTANINSLTPEGRAALNLIARDFKTRQRISQA